MNARVFSLVLVTAIFMGAWTTDETARQLALARKASQRSDIHRLAQPHSAIDNEPRHCSEILCAFQQPVASESEHRKTIVFSGVFRPETDGGSEAGTAGLPGHVSRFKSFAALESDEEATIDAAPQSAEAQSTGGPASQLDSADALEQGNDVKADASTTNETEANATDDATPVIVPGTPKLAEDSTESSESELPNISSLQSTTRDIPSAPAVPGRNEELEQEVPEVLDNDTSIPLPKNLANGRWQVIGTGGNSFTITIERDAERDQKDSADESAMEQDFCIIRGADGRRWCFLRSRSSAPSKVRRAATEFYSPVR